MAHNPRSPEYGEGFFRCFEVTTTVHLPRYALLPTTADEWFSLVTQMGSSLERIVEIRYPLATDIVDRRRNRTKFGPVYS